MKKLVPVIFLLIVVFTNCDINQKHVLVTKLVDDSSFTPPTNTERFRLFDSDWKFYKGELNGAELPNYDDSAWRIVDLPHDWSIENLPNQIENEVIGPFDKNSIGHHNTGFTVGGTGWYRKSFVIDESARGKHFSIYFDGVYMESDVWLNGHHLGYHPNGYTPFYYSLNDYLNPAGQENILVVQVKNTGVNSRWYSGSGIYRHVWLRVTESLNIPVFGVFVTTPEISSENAKVEAEITIQNKSEFLHEYKIRNTILSPDEKIVATSEKIESIESGAKKVVKRFLDVSNPQLWSIETPLLYTLKTELITDGNVLDTEETKFGIRSISFSPDNGFLLNGNSVLLQGACIHHDNGPLGSAAFDRAEQRKVEILKASGFNAIRTSHNPPSQSFLDACDRLGMLVIDEAFDMWELPKRSDDYHRFFKKWHKRDLQAMILRDRNHPSVIMWSIGNEIKERADTSGIRIAKDLIQIVKKLDTSRPVTNAICSFWEFKDRKRKWEESAPAFALLDVCGYNYKINEYAIDHQLYPERIIVGTESFGKEIYENWEMAHELPYVIGDFVWTGMDYLGEAGIGQAVTDSISLSWPWINSNCGDIDLIGYKKQQAYYRDVVWDRSKLEIAVEENAPEGKNWLISNWGWRREYPSWNWKGNEGKNMNVYVYTKCDKVHLELNGKIIETQQSIPDSKFTFHFSVPYEAGELKAIAFSEGKEVTSKSLVTTGNVEKIKIESDRKLITRNRNDLAYLTIELTDANGNRVFDSDATIQFTVQGEADIIGVANGNPEEPKSFQANHCKTYCGRCMLILRPNGKSGKAIISASYSLIAPETYTLEIK